MASQSPDCVLRELGLKLINMGHGHSLTVRATALTGFGELCTALALDAAALLGETGLPTDAEAEPERRLPATRVAAVLDLAATRAGRTDFGLQMAKRRGFANMGPVGLLARDEPSVGSAVATLFDFMPIHNDALALTRTDDGDSVIVSGRLLVPGMQANDLTLAMILRVLHQLAGSDWQPEVVLMARPRPDDTRAFGQFFGQRPQFDAGRNALVVPRAVLDRPNQLADPAFHRLTGRTTPQGEAIVPDSIAARIRRILPILIANQRCTAEHVASRLGVSRRTLNRRLADEGMSFLALLDTVRDDIVRREFAMPARKLADIADTLGFSSPAAFSGWFRRRHGTAPRDWRRRQGIV